MQCTEVDCDRETLARGLCSQHYKAWQRAGRPPGPSLRPTPESLGCSIDGCGGAAYSKQRCEKHYRQVLRQGVVRADHQEAGECAVTACSRRAESLGWCHGHYLRWLRSGDTLADKPLERAQATTCTIANCTRPHQARGFCLAHYQRLLSSGSARPDDPLREIAGKGFVHRGYVIVPVSPEERWLTNGQTPVAEHRLVMARALGRPLRATESVHHRSGNRADNRLANLELWSRYQPSGQHVSDKLDWALELVRTYAPYLLRDENGLDDPETAEPTSSVARKGFEPS